MERVLAAVGVVTGLEFEADVIRAHARHAGVADRVLVAAGFGRDRARRAAEALVQDGAQSLLSFGIAGGLSPCVVCGTAIIATAVQAQNMEPIPCSGAWVARLCEALASSQPLTRGNVTYAAAILATRLEKASAFASTQALAADMESYGVGEAALAASIPFAAIRVIADTSSEDLPEIALHAMAPDGSLKLAETVGRVFKSPGQIPALMRLGRSTAIARRRLNVIASLSAARLFFSAP